MNIEIGTEYVISETAQKNFNCAEALTIIRTSGVSIQFTLNGQKGHGSMPIQHFEYLLKKRQLLLQSSKRQMLAKDQQEKIV